MQKNGPKKFFFFKNAYFWDKFELYVQVPARFYENNFSIENELKTGLAGQWQTLLDNVINHDVKLKQFLDQTEVKI